MTSEGKEETVEARGEWSSSEDNKGNVKENGTLHC